MHPTVHWKLEGRTEVLSVVGFYAFVCIAVEVCIHVLGLKDELNFRILYP